MSIVTFWGSGKEQVGKTLSLVAVATNMAIDHNKKILILSASYSNETLKKCYWSEKANKKVSIFKPQGKVSLYSGIEGLAKIIESNKITPELITDYTKIVFKNRLEVLLGFERNEIKTKENDRENMFNTSTQHIGKAYAEIARIADKYYDMVFVDLDNEIEKTEAEAIINMSDVVVAMTSQKISSIEKMKKIKDEVLGKKGILLIGKYDKKSKYSAKNIMRQLGERQTILTLPYNTLFFEAAEEAMVTDLFLRLRNIKDKNDENEFFMQQIRKLSDEITNRIQEARMIK